VADRWPGRKRRQTLHGPGSLPRLVHGHG
jgi:hypothetical protein